MLNFVQSVLSFLDSPVGFFICLSLYVSIFAVALFEFISFLRRNKNNKRGDKNV